MAQRKRVPIIHWHGHQLYPIMHRYAETENIRIDLYEVNPTQENEFDEVYAKATTNLPWAKLPDTEVMIKGLDREYWHCFPSSKRPRSLAKSCERIPYQGFLSTLSC